MIKDGAISLDGISGEWQVRVDKHRELHSRSCAYEWQSLNFSFLHLIQHYKADMYNLYTVDLYI